MLLVENFRNFFPASKEKNNLDFTKLEKYKTYIKAFDSLAKLFSKEISAPFSKIYSFMNYLSFDNKKYEYKGLDKNFFDTSLITFDEKGFELLETQANLILQPVCALGSASQIIFHLIGQNKDDYHVRTITNEISQLSLSAGAALTALFLVRKSLTAKKSLVKLQDIWNKKDLTNKELMSQGYKTFLDVASLALKISEKITPKWCSRLLKTTQAVINILKVPSKLEKQKVKEEKALKQFEASIKKQLDELSSNKLSSNDSLEEFKRLYKQIKNSSDCEILVAFRDALKNQSWSCKAATAA